MPLIIGETLQSLLQLDYNEEVIKNNKFSTVIFVVDPDSKHHRKVKEEPDVLIQSETNPISEPPKEIYEQGLMASAPEEASSEFSDLVASLAINTEDREKICQRLGKQVRDVVRRKCSPGKKLILTVEIHLVTTYWLKSRVPATLSSIENLEKGTMMDFAVEDYHGDQKSCCVCLEGFQADSLVKQMPCSHIFHRKCIDQWLHSSHYCPLCRFEMPTPSTCDF